MKVEEKHKSSSPVFVLSPAPRCGTTYLTWILQIHPDFQLPNLLWEDFVMEHVQFLKDYVHLTSKRWEHRIKSIKDFKQLFLKHLGDGILSFLCEQIEENKRLLCKTPRSYNLNDFFVLFPNAKLLIVIRDGRDVVTSAVKTWANRILAFERSTWRWAEGARQVLDFMEGNGNELRGKSWMLVKYEDILESPEDTILEMLGFLDIDSDTFDMTQIENLPLRGSSVHRGEKNKVHWDPVEKPKDFQPIGRWKSWRHWQKKKFKIIAGRELIRLGYVGNNDW